MLEQDFSFNALFTTLKNVSIGTKIRINVNGVQREVTVKGILKSKVQDISRNAYMVDSQFRSIIGRNDGNVSEIAVKLNPGINPSEVSKALVLNGVDKIANIRTYYEAQPQFLKDVIKTFGMLGNMLGSIGLVVASITIFIVIFINAITRRKFIGILKGSASMARRLRLPMFSSPYFTLFAVRPSVWFWYMPFWCRFLWPIRLIFLLATEFWLRLLARQFCASGFLSYLRLLPAIFPPE